MQSFKEFVSNLSEAVNRGFKAERRLVKHLNKHGLMRGRGAGNSSETDFHLIDKRTTPATKIKGKAGNKIKSEHKSSVSRAVFGQLTLTRHPQTGKWHISDAARARRPEYARHIENATVTVNGRKKKLLDHLNSASSSSDVHSDTTDLKPAQAYMNDHGVDVAHIDSHGTYRAGLSHSEDRHGLGLPKMQGEGRFRVRQKVKTRPNSKMVEFRITNLKKSKVDIGTDDGANTIKKRLGH